MDFSIGIMTQRSKEEHITVLLRCLIGQNMESKSQAEVVFFCERGTTIPYIEELREKYNVQQYIYKKPFNIGAVRNCIIRASRGEYVVYLDDDVAIGPNYFNKLTRVVRDRRPGVIAGLSYQVFRKPDELLSELEMMKWAELIKKLGRRDHYTRRIGRYGSERLVDSSLGEVNWLGAIGRNMVIQRERALRTPFFEFTTMGFQDLEFAYRVQNMGGSVILKNDSDLACLHLFHSYKPTRFSEYRQTFHALVQKGRLPAESERFFFRKRSQVSNV